MDASLDIGIVAFDFLVLPIHLLDQVDLGSLEVTGHALVAYVGNQFADLRVLGVDVSALVGTGKKGGSPVLGFDDGNPSRAQGDEAGEVFVFRTETVVDPASHTRANEVDPLGPGIHEHERRLVIGDVGIHRVDDAEIIDLLGDLGEEIAGPDAALSMLGELERGLHQRPRLPLRPEVFARNFFSVIFFQFRFVVERIDLRWTAVGENVNDPLRPSWEVGLSRCQRIQVAVAGLQRGEKRAETERTHPHPGTGEEVTSRGERGVHREKRE